MRGRGRGDGNLFGGTEPEDAAPGLDELIRRSGRPRRQRRSRAPRPIGQVRYTAHTQGRPAVRRGILVARLVLAGALLVLGLVLTVAGAAEAATGYAQAGTLASAPACPAAVANPMTTTEDCVANVILVTTQGVWDDGGEEAILLEPSPMAPPFYFTPTFPGDAAFFATVNDALGAHVDDVPVRAEFWQGNIVELTAGSGAHAATVSTDANPNDQGGTALGAALMGLALIEFGLLLFYAVRAVRLRWLRPGLKLRLSVTSLLLGGLGSFVASICLINQPARVGLIVIVAPMVTLVVLMAAVAVETSYWFGPGRRAGLGIPTQRPYRGR